MNENGDRRGVERQAEEGQGVNGQRERQLNDAEQARAELLIRVVGGVKSVACTTAGVAAGYITYNMSRNSGTPPSDSFWTAGISAGFSSLVMKSCIEASFLSCLDGGEEEPPLLDPVVPPAEIVGMPRAEMVGAAVAVRGG